MACEAVVNVPTKRGAGSVVESARLEFCFCEMAWLVLLAKNLREFLIEIDGLLSGTEPNSFLGTGSIFLLTLSSRGESIVPRMFCSSCWWVVIHGIVETIIAKVAVVRAVPY